jgi:hypothetical protein
MLQLLCFFADNTRLFMRLLLSPPLPAPLPTAHPHILQNYRIPKLENNAADSTYVWYTRKII